MPKMKTKNGIFCCILYGVLDILATVAGYRHRYGPTFLYTPDDPIVKLTPASFDRSLVGSETAWVVEYYSTWCGGCQRFAPYYREFAKDVQAWSSVVRVAGVACSDPNNQPICSSQNIKTYPALKFYPKHLPAISRGHTMSVQSSSAGLALGTLRFVDQFVPVSETSPSLKLFSTITQLRQSVRSTPSDLMAIVEDNGSTPSITELAQLVIMDVSSLRPRLVIGRLPKSALPNSAAWTHPLPAVVAIHLNMDMVRYIAPLQSRGASANLLRQMSGELNIFLQTPQTSLPTTETTTTIPTTICSTTGYPTRPSQQPDFAYGIYQEDLDSNIYYTLWNEVSSRSKIKGKAMKALKDYIHVLSKYHPGNRRLKSYLRKLDEWIQDVGGSLKSQRYLNGLERLQSNNSFVVKNMNWKSCHGSSGQFRGYPCSLWMTFHSLTVAVYNEHLQNPSEPFKVLDVMNVIRAYIKNFFGCRSCVDHFMKMSKRMRKEIKRPQDGVLWLWKSHNKVNHRLHHEESEDPAHPKVQFPRMESCPNCRYNNRLQSDKFDNDTNWNEVEVLKFLTSFYVPLETKSQPQQGVSGPPFKHAHSSNKTCALETTPWTDCSVSCGSGVSTRFSNANNSDCQMNLEMRICQLRRCDVDYRQWVNTRTPEQCANDAANLQESNHANLEFNNCTTTSSYRWRYCGVCPGYCCNPIRDSTFWAEMTCGGKMKHTGQAQVMWIERCACRRC